MPFEHTFLNFLLIAATIKRINQQRCQPKEDDDDDDDDDVQPN